MSRTASSFNPARCPQIPAKLAPALQIHQARLLGCRACCGGLLLSPSRVSRVRSGLRISPSARAVGEAVPRGLRPRCSFRLIPRAPRAAHVCRARRGAKRSAAARAPSRPLLAPAVGWLDEGRAGNVVARVQDWQTCTLTNLRSRVRLKRIDVESVNGVRGTRTHCLDQNNYNLVLV